MWTLAQVFYMISISKLIKGDSMANLYEQFLGSKPGTVVELVDESTSPFLVRTAAGFEFFVSAEDFRNYYREKAGPTPPRWGPFVTDPQTGVVDSRKMALVMDIIHSFEATLQDFEKARSVVRQLIKLIEDNPAAHPDELLRKLDESGWEPNGLTETDVKRLINAPPEVRELLRSHNCAEILGADLPEALPSQGHAAAREPTDKKTAVAGEKKPTQRAAVTSRAARTKNVSMSVDGDILTVEIDLSKDFGPSKSGKTTIVASTEGNKSVPGRTEKIGLNVYKQEGKKSAMGRKKSFKNVEMDLQGRILTVTVDLSQEFGPSKSGKTIIIASSEGNQLVYGSEEKIGLNVYRKIE
jgi:hypothetical protein